MVSALCVIYRSYESEIGRAHTLAQAQGGVESGEVDCSGGGGFRGGHVGC